MWGDKILNFQLQFYSDKLKKLEYPLSRKVLKFLEHNCIERVESHWICKPIEGYNTRTHTITDNNGHYVCSCQGYQSKLRKGLIPICSHVIAVRLLKNDLNMKLQGGLFE